MDKRLERNQQNKMMAGVASGLADYFDMDVTLIRVLFIVAVVFGFSGILLYVVLWIAVPERPFFQNFRGPDAPFDPNMSSFNTAYNPKAAPFNMQNELPVQPIYQKKSTGSGRTIAGLFLIVIGGYFMLAELDLLPDWFSILKLWPLVLIALGLAMMFQSEKKKLPPPPVMNWDPKPEKDINSKLDDQPLS